MIKPLALAASALTLLAACGGGDMPSGGLDGQTARASTDPGAPLSSVAARERQPERNLTFSGQGNSGGILSHQGGTYRGQVEATVRSGSTAPPDAGFYYTEGNTIDFHNGPLTGIQISCGYGYRGNSRICTAQNAREANIVHQYITQYGFAAIVTVGGFGAGNGESAVVGVHSRNPNGQGTLAGLPPMRPQGTASYVGDFRGSLIYRDDETAFSGNVNGYTNFAADFDAGTISGQIRTFANSTEVTADFRNAVVGRDGNFFTAAGTEFTFAGARAQGMVEGGIYGPLGQETVGVAAIQNSNGGLNGVFRGTDERLIPKIPDYSD